MHDPCRNHHDGDLRYPYLRGLFSTDDLGPLRRRRHRAAVAFWAAVLFAYLNFR
jgi:hypothetical protein